MTTYAATNAAVEYIGYWTDNATQRNMRGGGTRVAFRMYGKSLTLHCFPNATGTSTMEYSTDGGATFTAYNFGATGNTTTTDLVGAGSDGFYNIVIRGVVSQNLLLYLTDAFNITADGTPSIAAPMEGWTVKYFSESDWTDIATNATLGANVRGHTFLTTDAQYGYASPKLGYLPTWYDGFAVFRASCTKIAVWARQGGYSLFRDGVQVGSAVLPSGIHSLQILSASEDGAEHEYRIVMIKKTSATAQINGVAILGSFSSVAPNLGRRVAFLGDSTTTNDGTTANSDQGQVCKLIGQTNLVAFNRGVNGNTSAQMNTRIAADVLGLASLYAVCITSGANDGAVADATLQATMQTMYGAVLSDDAATLCYAVETYPTTSSNREGAVIAAAVTAVADSRCIYVDTDGWIVAATDTHDGQHPNYLGGQKIADKFRGFLPYVGWRNVLLMGVG